MSCSAGLGGSGRSGYVKPVANCNSPFDSGSSETLSSMVGGRPCWNNEAAWNLTGKVVPPSNASILMLFLSLQQLI